MHDLIRAFLFVTLSSKTELRQTMLLYNNQTHLFPTTSALVPTRGDEELRWGGEEKSFWRLIFQEILARDARRAYTEIADCLRPYCTAKHGNRYNNLLRSSFVQFQSTTIHSLGSFLTQSNTAKILFSCYLQIYPKVIFTEVYLLNNLCYKWVKYDQVIIPDVIKCLIAF